MQRKFNPILDELPSPFYEDVYLLDKSGNVIFCRQGTDRKIKNIFDIIDKDELGFIEENAILSGINPLLLISSAAGPIFLDTSLVIKKRVFLAIIPHFSEKRTFEIVRSECSFALASSKIQEGLRLVRKRDLTGEERAFVERLSILYRLEMRDSHTHGKTNAEIAEMMLDFACEISAFIGCEAKCDVRGISIFEIKNELCLYSYKFMLFILCFASRIYSDERRALIDIFFDEMGIFMNVSFELADIYVDTEILESGEFYELIKNAQSDSFLIECEQNENRVLFCGYLWQHSADFEHIKKKITDILYKMKGE